MNGRRIFSEQGAASLSAASLLNPGSFVAVFVIGDNPEDEHEVLATMQANVEHCTSFLEHMRDMIDTMLTAKPVDLRCEGGMQ